MPVGGGSELRVFRCGGGGGRCVVGERIFMDLRLFSGRNILG